jgi:hypothetical protein
MLYAFLNSLSLQHVPSISFSQILWP